MWYQNNDFIDGYQVSNLYAVVETENGKVIYLEPKDIRFIDYDKPDLLGWED